MIRKYQEIIFNPFLNLNNNFTFSGDWSELDYSDIDNYKDPLGNFSKDNIWVESIMMMTKKNERWKG